MLLHYFNHWWANTLSLLFFIKNHFFATLNILLFILSLLVCLKLNFKTNKKLLKISSEVEAIAGDDAVATQLDMARAFLEIGNKPKAKKILQQAIQNSSGIQLIEAKKLLGIAQQGK